MQTDTTRFSEQISGDRRNHNLPVAFDYSTGGYVGIEQFDDDGNVADRVLLTPKQIRELIKFVGPV